MGGSMAFGMSPRVYYVMYDDESMYDNEDFFLMLLLLEMTQ